MSVNLEPVYADHEPPPPPPPSPTTEPETEPTLPEPFWNDPQPDFEVEDDNFAEF
ncbi:hypothetical protein [Sphingomonas sp.]|uniref:hypothetical protein n=1 Tax=Sphingomonas sp. TaxID=28214 RepID=UPI0025DC4C4C|nr:hypothetical protein [Sphingomonas sp.]